MSYKKIYLGNGRFSLVDDWNYEKVSKYLWTVNRGNYAITSINGKTVLLHRVIMNLYDSENVVDHIDGDRLDNRECNLRICTQLENMANKLPRRHGTSKYNGVHFSTKEQKWLARITSTVNKKRLFGNIGFYETEEEAGLAFNIVSKELRGEFTKLNEIDSNVSVVIKKRQLNILRKRFNITLNK